MKNLKVVIPCAGNGTRHYPETLEVPKEMFPIGSKPILQIIIETITEAGIPEENIALVINEEKQMIKEYFSKDYKDEIRKLYLKGKDALADEIQKIPTISHFIYQEGPYGAASPLWSARDFVGSSDVLFVFPDDLFFLTKAEKSEFGSDIRQMLDAYKFYGGSILACKKVENDNEYDKYGIISGRRVGDSDIMRFVTNIDEKPGKENAKSDMANVSAFLFQNVIFEKLEKAYAEFDGIGEFMIQPVIQSVIDDGYDVYGLMIRGIYCDTGNRLDYRKTCHLFALYDTEEGEEYLRFVRNHLPPERFSLQ